MKITGVESFAVRLPRDRAAATGTAGSPTTLKPASSDVRWSEVYPAMYSVNFESALVRVSTDAGLTGWGEAQAPMAPEVVCAIIDRLLGAVLLGSNFEGTPGEIAAIWERMYSAMRVRGQTGGFMLDAISGVDLALWDLAGQVANRPVSELIAGKSAKCEVPCYVSGLAGKDDAARVESARHFASEGYTTFKIYCDRDLCEIIGTLDTLRTDLPPGTRIAVDALWRLTGDEAASFGEMLDEREVLWLECPFMPEEVAAHEALARRIRTPIALGESYRTRYELAPFFERRAVSIVQPDLGRCGVTEGLRIARAAQELGLSVVPHVSIALGPQIAAAIHFAAAIPNCDLVEFNPAVLETANRYLANPILARNGHYIIPRETGLGATIEEPPD